jgi:hypothetical protein
MPNDRAYIEDVAAREKTDAHQLHDALAATGTEVSR